MSYIEVFVVQENGDVVSYSDEPRNNHSWAPLIWECMMLKYGYQSKMHSRYTEPDALSRFWKEWPSPRMTRLENILIGATFDFVWVNRSLVPELIEANQMFYDKFVKPQNYDDRGALGVIKALEGIKNEIPNYRGVAFNACSAISPFWIVRLEEDEEGGYETRPWNVDKDKEQLSGEYTGKRAWELQEYMEAYLEKHWIEQQVAMLEQGLLFESGRLFPVHDMQTKKLENLLVKLDVRLREETAPDFDIGPWLQLINEELARRGQPIT